MDEIDKTGVGNTAQDDAGSDIRSAVKALLREKSATDNGNSGGFDWRFAIAANSDVFSCAEVCKLGSATIFAPCGYRLTWLRLLRSPGMARAKMEIVDRLSWNHIVGRCDWLLSPGFATAFFQSSASVLSNIVREAELEIHTGLRNGGLLFVPLCINNAYSRGWIKNRVDRPVREMVKSLETPFCGIGALQNIVIVGGSLWDGFEQQDGIDVISSILLFAHRHKLPFRELYAPFARDSSVVIDEKPPPAIVFNEMCAERNNVIDDDEIEEKSNTWQSHVSICLVAGSGWTDSEMQSLKPFVSYAYRDGANFSLASDYESLRDCSETTHILFAEYPISQSELHTLANEIACYRQLDAILWTDMRCVLVHANLIRWLGKLESISLGDLSAWLEHDVCTGRQALVGAFNGTFTDIASARRPLCWSEAWPLAPKEKGLKIAVLSMCGVSSFQDRYGLGGEHQVVHWLRENLLSNNRVAVCDIYDTANMRTFIDNEYDIVFSNSCWVDAPSVKKNGVTIFWHFNTNARRMTTPEDVVGLKYDIIWTNSRTQYERLFKLTSGNCEMVDLNGSSFHHFKVPYKTDRFSHDACYIGGYQVYYKGKERIDAFVKPLVAREGIDFAIYGNRLWLSKEQKQAMERDSFFKPDYCDDSFECAYKGVLHPDDFRHLAASTKVWINFNAEDQLVVDMVNDRPIWAMCCGAFVITDDTPGQRALYGDVVEYSVGGQDVVDKTRYWLDHEKERFEKAEAGMRHVRDTLKLTTKETARKIIEAYEKRNS